MKVGEYTVEFEELKLPELSESEKDYFNHKEYKEVVDKKLNNLFLTESDKITILENAYVKDISMEDYAFNIDIAYETKRVIDQPQLVEFINKIRARLNRSQVRRESKIGKFRYKRARYRYHKLRKLFLD